MSWLSRVAAVGASIALVIVIRAVLRPPPPARVTSRPGAQSLASARHAPGSPLLMEDGKAHFKVVVFGYSGVCGALSLARAALPADASDTWQLTSDSGWTFCSFDFDVAGARWDERPIRLHVFGHEGMGYIGQPGTAKDVVFKNAHAVLALADADEQHHLASVLDSEMTRLHARGTWPVVELVVQTGVGVGGPPTSAVGGESARVGRAADWKRGAATLLVGIPRTLLVNRK